MKKQGVVYQKPFSWSDPYTVEHFLRFFQSFFDLFFSICFLMSLFITSRLRSALRLKASIKVYDGRAPDCIIPDLFDAGTVETCAITIYIDPRPWISKFLQVSPSF